MHKHPNVLFIVASANNLFPILKELHNGGLYPVWQWVKTATALSAGLADHPWDAIIADYDFPGFDVLAILTTVHQSQFDIPFIVISDTVGERLAVEMIKAGAHNYLMRDNLALLPEILQNEITGARERLNHKQNHKQTISALRKTETKYRAIYDNAVEGIYQSTPTGHYLMANMTLARIYGYPSPEAIVSGLNDIKHQLYVDPQRREEFERVIAEQGYIIGFESQVYRRDGRTLWISENGWLVRDEQGYPSYYEGFVTDISDRKRIEAAHRQSAARTKAAFEQAVVGFAESDMQTGQLTLVNPFFCKMTGYSQAELLKMTVNDVSHPDDAAKSVENIRQLFSGQIESFQVEKRYLRKDGTFFWAETTVYLVHLPEDQDTHCLAIVQDISDRKQLEIERSKAQQQLQHLNQVLEARVEERTKALMMTQSAVDLAADCVFMIRPDGHFHYVNDTACSKLGYARDQLLTRSITDIYPTLLPENWVQIWQKIEQQPAVTLEIQHQPKRGEVYPVEVTANYLEFDGETYALAFARDITERKQAEMQLRLTNEKLVRATHLKDEFLANMSHELRTPLNTILGMAESLQEQVFGEIHEQQVKPLHMIRRSGKHLLELINDILDVAKIESGQMELDIALSAIEPICQESLTFIMQQADQKSIQVETSWPSRLPNVHVDKRRMRQVLINLLSNAVKFTPKGGRICLEASLQPHPTASTSADIKAFVRIAISDTGIGIASEHISKLFEPFIQIDSDLNRKYSGTGLGLALVKRIVELHGGVVGVKSKLGNGSCFTVDLPCNPAVSFPPVAPLAPPQVLSKPEGKQTKLMGASLILLAENKDANSITIMSYLRAKGYGVQIAATCQGVIDLAQTALPDLILIDSQLPGIDTLDVIQQIRCESDLTELPIIALAASDIKNLSNRYHALGTYRYLSKPFKVKHLSDAIQRLLQESSK